MDNQHKKNKSIDEDFCKTYLESKVFSLQPESYKKKYPNWPGLIGLEIEFTLFKKVGDRLTRTTYLELESLVEAYSVKKKWHIERYEQDFENKKGKISKVVIPDLANLTFEPGGQLECSTFPVACLNDALENVNEIQNELNQFFESKNVFPFYLSLDPWNSVEQIGLQLNKKRYQQMDTHYSDIGPWGQRMMRQTCGIQVNLDFGHSEEQLVKRFLAANLLAPICIATFANSPQLDGKLTDFKSSRTHIWQNSDPSRVGIYHLKNIEKNMSIKSCVESYWNFVKLAKVVFFSQKNYLRPDKSLSFLDWMKNGYQNVFPDLADFESHLSLMFPEVRPKGFLEFRCIDGQNFHWQSVPSSYLSSLFYSDQVLNSLLELLLPEIDNIQDLYKGSVYGLNDSKIKRIAQKVMQLSIDGLTYLPECYQSNMSKQVLQNYAENYTLNGLVPADKLCQSGGEKGFFDMNDFERIKNLQLNSINKLL